MSAPTDPAAALVAQADAEWRSFQRGPAPAPASPVGVRSLDVLEAALALAALGLPVVVLCRPVLESNPPICTAHKPGTCKLKNLGKRPVGAEWQNRATCDAATLRAELREPRNIGLLCGPRSGVLVIDVDTGPGHEGAATLAALEAQLGPLPQTVRARTGSGGAHLLFAWPAGLTGGGAANALGPGVDLRGENNQIVVAPSLHRSGPHYEWLPCCAPGERPLAELPAAWLARILNPPTAPKRVNGTKPPAAKPHRTASASATVEEAVARYNGDHPQTWGLPGSRPCPVCCEEGGCTCAGQLADDPARCACFNPDHGATGVGLKGKGCWHFDALDVDAHAEGRSRIAHLVAQGYLAPLPPRPEDPPPPDDRDAPEPGSFDVSEEERRAEAAERRRAAENAASPDARAERALAGLVTPTDPEWLEQEPERRPYLLEWVDPVGTPRGVLPAGKVAMLAAAGGGGKSWLTVELGLAVAAGVPWLGFRVALPGRVALLLAEEEPAEARRRLYYAARAIGLTPRERQIAASKLHVLALAGHGVALTRTLIPGETGLPVTPLARALMDVLAREAGPEGWRLVALDPLARFAGDDAESANAAATRLCQVLERYTALPGSPTVWLTHHTAQASRRGQHSTDTDPAATTAVRGVTGLTDGARWVATLEPARRVEGAPLLSVLRVTKTNYGWVPPDTHLLADPALHGAPRCASAAEVAGRAAADAAQQTATADTKREREREAACEDVLRVIRGAASPVSQNALESLVSRRASTVRAGIALAAQRGLIIRRSERPYGWILASDPGCVPVRPECVPDAGGVGASRVPVGDADARTTHSDAASRRDALPRNGASGAEQPA